MVKQKLIDSMQRTTKRGMGWEGTTGLSPSDRWYHIIRRSLCVNWLCHLIFLENEYLPSSYGYTTPLFICTTVTIVSTKFKALLGIAILECVKCFDIVTFFFPNLCIYRPFSRGNFTGRAFGSFARRWKALASWMEFSSCVTAPR